jgi:hypothetical protein
VGITLQSAPEGTAPLTLSAAEWEEFREIVLRVEQEREAEREERRRRLAAAELYQEAGVQ